MVLDQVGVVGRARNADEHRPGLRVERDRGAALAAQCVERDALRLRLQGQVQVVALDRLALELVERRVEHRAQVRVRAGQEVVLGLLEPGPRANLGRVADDVGREAALRVLAEVERLPAGAAPVVVGQDRVPVTGDDRAALDRELGDALDRVVLPVGQAVRRPRLPVRRPDDQGREQDEPDDRDARDLAVHSCPPARAGSMRSPDVRRAGGPRAGRSWRRRSTLRS